MLVFMGHVFHLNNHFDFHMTIKKRHCNRSSCCCCYIVAVAVAVAVAMHFERLGRCLPFSNNIYSHAMSIFIINFFQLLEKKCDERIM